MKTLTRHVGDDVTSLNSSPRRRRQLGMVLITVVVIGGVLGITLTSLLLWAGSHSQVTSRSQVWNNSLTVAEAGVEEAFSQLKAHANSLNSNGWSLAQGQYTKTRNFGGGYYTVNISTDSAPVIISQGFVPAPLKTSVYISRTVRVTTTNTPLFFAGLVFRQWVEMNGNNVDVDSYDPNDSNWSTGGAWDPNKRHDQGNICTISGLTNSFAIGNASIWGKISTGPNGAVRIGPNGSVGDVAWHTAGDTGIEPGFFSSDFTGNLPPVVAPNATTVPTGGSGYQYVLGNGNYIASDLTGSVLVNGNATLTVTNKIKMSSGNNIVFAAGATLTLYVSAQTAQFGGNSLANSGGPTSRLVYFGLPSNTSITFKGNTTFTGAIYAPNADITMGGGGSGTPIDVSGAINASTLTMGGRFQLHYDESLGKILPAGFAVASWTEL